MNKVAIVTDSTAYLPQSCIDQYHITITPLSVIWGRQIYRDGVDIQPADFYERLKTTRIMPTTSQVTPAAMLNVFHTLLAQSFDVLGIFISSKISGTVHSAIQARSNSGAELHDRLRHVAASSAYSTRSNLPLDGNVVPKK